METTRLRLIDSGWGSVIDEALTVDPSSLWIICPFIKKRVALRLLAGGKSKNIQVITRFNLSDFGEGVSDTGALRLLLDHGAQIRGICGLHAKLYLIGQRAIVTSANLTETALSRNHEFGFVATDDEIVRQCIEYFEKLWQQAGENLTKTRIDGWEKQISDALAFRHRPTGTIGLGDEGVKVSMPDEPSGGAKTGTSPSLHDEPARWTGAPQAFVKFFGESTNRVDRNRSILDEVQGSGCHWACTYPKGKRPRQVQDGAVMFMARFVEEPDDIIIYGRAVGIRHRDALDDATPEDIAKREWKVKWPHYVRVHHPEFLAGTLSNGISLGWLMKELAVDAFAVTQENAATGQGNTDPRRAYRQHAAVRLSREGLEWLNARFQEAFEKHGRFGAAEFDQLDWPTTPQTASGTTDQNASTGSPFAKDLIYERLKEAARAGNPVTYSDIAPLADLDLRRADHRNQIAAILGDISESEHAQGRPMLSVVVVQKEKDGTTRIPGKGFFEFAKKLGVQGNEDDMAFFDREFAEACKEWQE